MSAADKQNRVNFLPLDDDFEQPSTMAETGVNIPVVRRLSRPPEIWELVQPVPARRRSFANPLSTRLPSSRSILILVVAVIVCVGGYVGIRSGKRIGGTTATSVVTPSHVESIKAAATVKAPIQESVKAASSETVKASSLESNPPVVTPSVVTPGVNETTAVAESVKPKRKASHQSKLVGNATEVGNRAPVNQRVSSAEASQVSLPTNQKAQSLGNTKTSGASSSDGTPNRKETSLSPQLINSSKTTPQKPKVIQWP